MKRTPGHEATRSQNRPAVIFPSILVVLVSTLAACSRPEKVAEITRGRLRCTEMVERHRVNNYWREVFVDRKPFILSGINSNKVGQCQASNNPDAEVLVLLFGDNCWSLRLDGDKPLVTPLEKPEGMDSIQQYKSAEFACGGRCLVWPTQMTFLETNETKKFSRLPSRFIGFSPALRTAITEGRNDSERNQLSINLVDMKTAKVTERFVNRANNLWLLDYTERVEGIAAHFKWERRTDGQDQLIYPAEEKPKDRK